MEKINNFLHYPDVAQVNKPPPTQRVQRGLWKESPGLPDSGKNACVQRQNSQILRTHQKGRLQP